MTRHPSRPVVAFFDADETLVRMKSPFSLLRYRLARQGDDGSGYERLVEPLRRRAREGGAPAEVSALFYRSLAGVPWDELLEQGRQWYADLCRSGVPFVESTVEALRRHRAAGHTVAVVSGAWRASLEPLTEELGADFVLCSEPELDPRGRLTGGVRRAMFGRAKAEAVAEVLAGCGASAADCYGYADDPGDLPMLEPLGHPTVVGDHPVMTALAARRGWATLPATSVPGAQPQPV